jgi:hypothetical protein
MPSHPTKFNPNPPFVSNVALTSDVQTSAILELFSYEIKRYGIYIILNVITSCKISSKSISLFKSWTHLSSLNVRYFGMVEAMGLYIMDSKSPSMPSLPYIISPSPTVGSKVAPTSEV